MQITYKYFIVALLATSMQTALSFNENIIPNSHKITLNITANGPNSAYDGVSEINLDVKKPTNSIFLYVREIEIKPGTDIKCNQQPDIAILKTDPALHIGTDIFEIIFTKDLLIGSNCNLTIGYSLRNPWKSLQHDEYESADGKKTWMIGYLTTPNTKFPRLLIRNLMMNCTISIGHSRSNVALSNMHVVKEDFDPKNPEWITTHFAESPKMNLDNVKFIIGDFVEINNNSEEFRLWYWRDSLILPDHIQEVGSKLMKALDDYTGLPFKLHGFKKLDLVLIRDLLYSDATSNWGIIFFENTDLYEYQNSPTTERLERIIQTMAHELSHQWFGGLIDTACTDCAWLLEGFANYLEYVITDEIEPTWRIMDKFVTKNIQTGAFWHDATINSLPLQWSASNVDNPNVYDKSATVIRMISYVFGENRFKTGLKNYIKTRAFGTTTSEDFIDELVKLCPENKNLLKILNNWVTTRGYPVINVKRNYKAEKAKITRSRFLMDINEVSDEKYWVAINFVTDDNLNFTDTNITHWFDSSIDIIVIDQLKEHQFIILNKQQFGYYRVNYDERNWELIINYLTNEDHSRIHVLNRAQLIDDAFNLALVGQLRFKVLLSLLGYLKQETDYIPWSVAWRVIDYLYGVVIVTEIEDTFKSYVLKLANRLQDVVLYVEVDNTTDHIIDQKRNDALKWTCKFGSIKCRAQAVQIFKKWIENPAVYKIPETDMHRVICAGLLNDDQEMPKELWNELYSTIIKCPLSVEVLKKCLSGSIAQDPTNEWFSLNFYFISSQNPNSVTAALDYVIEHYNKIIAFQDFTNDDFEKNILKLSYEIRTKMQRDKLKSLIELNESTFKTGDQILAEVDSNLKGIQSEIRVFKDFFDEK